MVFSAIGVRESEARCAASLFVGAAIRGPLLKSFPDGFMPYVGAEVKAVFEELKLSVSPDLILCPWRKDAHQDHRLISELTWNTFRNHLILEYEIPKYDGDMGQPNVLFRSKLSFPRKRFNTSWSHSPRSEPSAGLRRAPFFLSCGCAAWNATLPTVMPKHFSVISCS